MFLSREEYVREVRETASQPLPWERLDGKTLLLTGATGLVGTFLVDTILWKREHDGLDCRIIAVGRNAETARARFGDALDGKALSFLAWDVNEDEKPHVSADYVIHAASNTHPRVYASDPIGSVMTNLLGLRNVLELARQAGAQRTLFLSSVEIYGKAWHPEDLFDEAYCGYIDCNTLRAGYPEGKRAGEALCQAYRAKYGMEIVIPRLSRVYGPTMRAEDSKALAQFLHRAASGKDIILKSKGEQRFSYTYVPDAVTGILACLLCGEDGEAYNIAGGGSMTLREIAETLAAAAGTRVVFELPDEAEQRGYSTADVALLKTEKLRSIGWKPMYSEEAGLRKCVELL